MYGAGAERLMESQRGQSDSWRWLVPLIAAVLWFGFGPGKRTGES